MLTKSTARGYGPTSDCSGADVNVEFLKAGKWKLSIGSTDLMVVNFGIPELPREPFDGDQLKQALKEIRAGKIADELIELLEKSIKEIKKGGMIVIDAEAPIQASHLKGSCFRPEPFPINAGHLSRLSRMDGAIILDFDLMCHAFGAILDGRATTDEKSERGARYNSAVRYVQSREGKAVAIVISEDGYVDVIDYKEPKPAQEELICG